MCLKCRGRRLAWSLLLSCLLVFLGTWIVGDRLYGGSSHTVGAPPHDWRAQAVTFSSDSDALLHGWLASNAERCVGVVLLHGKDSDRRAMLGRARFLHARGYSVLLFDFRANGESPGRGVTFGYREALDVDAAVRFLRARTGVDEVAIIGFSMGAAAAVLGSTRPVPVDALVLEALYPTFEEAIANRIALRLGAWGRLLYPLFTWQLWLREGISPAQLRPIDRIAEVDAPVFLIAGTEDRRTTLSESRRIFRAARQPKSFWAVSGAGHEDFHRSAPAEYERRVLNFLDHALITRETPCSSGVETPPGS